MKEKEVENGVLYIVSTPIGNMDDITIRAIKILNSVDYIAAEDTRHTLNLLSHHKIKSHFLISFHEHNEIDKIYDLIEKLKDNKSIALLSNAGTPLISDPGFRLVKESIKNNIKVTPIPGAVALITGLSASGLPTDSFIFVGFVPRKGRRNFLKNISDNNKTVIFYESPNRIVSLIEEIILIMGDRYGVLCREMTKIYEEFLRGNLSDILNNLNNRDSVKGECTLIVQGKEDKKINDNDLEDFKSYIENVLKYSDEKPSILAKKLSKEFSIPRDLIYKEILKQKCKSD